MKIPDFILDEWVWSFSRLNSFAHGCKYCWYLNYVKKEEGINNVFAQWGTFGHEILEKNSKGELLIFELADYYKEHYNENVTFRFPKNKYVDLSQSYYDAGLKYFSEFEGFDDKYNILGVEKEVKFKLANKYKFIGYIDLLLEDKETKDIIVVDHKSKSSFKNKKEQLEYSYQPYLYSMPVIEEYKKIPKKIIFNMFRKQDLVEIPFNMDTYKEAQEWAVKIIEDVYNCEDFPVQKDKFFCSYLCSFREKCGALLE